MQRAVAAALAALLLTTSLWVFQAAPAHACSCEETSTASIDSASAAIIGSIVAIDDRADRWPDENALVATVDVVIDIKGNVPDQIFIDSYLDDGGNCGTNWRIGQEIGVLLYELEDGALGGGGCGEFGRALAEQYEPPISTGGLAEVIIVGGENAYRSVAYDAVGQPIAFGFEAGTVSQFDMCDDGKTMLEVTVDWSTDRRTIGARWLPTFELVSEWDVSGMAIFGIDCATPDGSAATFNGKPDTRREETFDTYRIDASGIVQIDEPFTGEPFTPPQGVWPRATTSNGTIEGQAWMNRVVRLDEPVEITPVETSGELVQIGAGMAPDVQRAVPVPQDAPAPEPAQPATPAEAAELEAAAAQAEAAAAAELGRPATNDGGLSNGVLFAVFGGLAVVALIVFGVLRFDK